MSFLVFYPTRPLSGLKQQQKPKKKKKNPDLQELGKLALINLT